MVRGPLPDRKYGGARGLRNCRAANRRITDGDDVSALAVVVLAVHDEANDTVKDDVELFVAAGELVVLADQLLAGLGRSVDVGAEK